MINKSLTIVFKQMTKDFDNNNVITVPLKIFNDLTNCLSAKLKLGILMLDVICLPNFSCNTIELSDDLIEKLNISLKTTCNISIKSKFRTSNRCLFK